MRRDLHRAISLRNDLSTAQRAGKPVRSSVINRLTFTVTLLEFSVNFFQRVNSDFNCLSRTLRCTRIRRYLALLQLSVLFYPLEGKRRHRSCENASFTPSRLETYAWRIVKWFHCISFPICPTSTYVTCAYKLILLRITWRSLLHRISSLYES